MSRAKRALAAFLLLAGAAYAGICVYMWWGQRSLIFQPDATVRRTPADVGIEFRPTSISIAGKGAVSAWWLPGTAGPPKSVAILYLRGNDRNLGAEVDRLATLRRLGLPVLAIDYRGYGASSGPPPWEMTIYEDAMAAWDHLVLTEKIDPNRIIVYGHSLGGAVAVELALHRPPACAIVLESTFTAMAEMGRRRYPLLPVDWLLTERFDTSSKITRLNLPMLFVHGKNDDIVPFEMSERLFRAAGEPKQMLLIEGAGHLDALMIGAQRVAPAIEHLLQRCGGR